MNDNKVISWDDLKRNVELAKNHTTIITLNKNKNKKKKKNKSKNLTGVKHLQSDQNLLVTEDQKQSDSSQQDHLRLIKDSNSNQIQSNFSHQESQVQIVSERQSKKVPSHIQLAILKSELLKDLTSDDIESMRVSVYNPASLKLKSKTFNGLRVNVSIRLHDTEKYAICHDNNGFLQLVFQASLRRDSFLRSSFKLNPYASWHGYQDTLDTWDKDIKTKFIGKGAFKGRSGIKITPPFTRYSAISVYSDNGLSADHPGLTDLDMYATIRIGNFVGEVELYSASGNELKSDFILIGQWERN